MTHSSVEEVKADLERLRRFRDVFSLLFGVLQGVMLHILVSGSLVWWQCLGSLAFGWALIGSRRRVKAGELALDEAIERRDQWRAERLAERHEAEIADYRETISRISKELARHAKHFN